MICTHCGEDNCKLINEIKSTDKDLSSEHTCCGAFLLGPIGIVCEVFEHGRKVKKEYYWVCRECGNKFKAQSTDSGWIKFMKLGAFLGCHQMSSRSFFYKGYQFPVCARCTGMILSAFVAIPLFFRIGVRFSTAILFCSIVLIDWSLQHFKIKDSTNMRRLITGFIGGYGWTTIHIYFYLIVYIIMFMRV